MTERKGGKLITDAREWTELHASDLAHTLVEFRRIWTERLIEDSNGNVDLRFYNLSQRSLFEMPLCKSTTYIQEKIGLPKGFYVVNGKVDLFGHPWIRDSYNYSRAHMFVSNRSGLIVDFCAGQFVTNPDKPYGSGSRTRTIVQFAPEFVQRFDKGFTVLIGKKEDLSKKLNIVYSDKQLRPNTL